MHKGRGPQILVCKFLVLVSSILDVPDSMIGISAALLADSISPLTLTLVTLVSYFTDTVAGFDLTLTW